MILEFSREDILNSIVVDPAWYRVLITEVQEKDSKDFQSKNTWLKGKILFNADTGDKKFEGAKTPFLWLFNSKAAWSAVGFCTALGMEPKEGSRARLDAETLVGKQIDMFIGQGLDQNQRVCNVVTGQYRVARSVEEAVANS